MKCPKCGLVHPSHEMVCRRCEIDLKTAEPRPRTVCVVAEPEARSPFASLKERVASRASRPAEPAKAPAPPAEKPASRVASLVTLKGAKGSALKDLLARRGSKSAQVTTINCARCAASMTLEREVPYNRTGPIALLVLGAVLAVAGIFFHLLWITAVLAIFAGIFYLRFGHTFWKCETCGFIVPRA